MGSCRALIVSATSLLASLPLQGTVANDLKTARSDESPLISIHRILPLVVGVLFFASPTFEVKAHSIPGAQTLHDLCRAADVVAIGRITLVSTPNPHATTLPPVDAEVTEIFREGDVKKGSIRFWPHRHGNEQYVVGEELFLFLEPTRAPERAVEAKYEAIEAIGDRFIVPVDRRAEWIDAARKYVALGKGPRGSIDPRELGRVSISMLASPETQLAHQALRDLMLAGAAPVIGQSDVPELLRIVGDANRPAMLRVGILSELERRKLTPVGSHWISVLETSSSNDRSAVISGAKSRWFVPEVNAALVAIVDRGSSDEAISAARAVGAEGNEAAVEALVRAVGREPAELRYTALGSLRRINTAGVRDKLEGFAQSHPDAETRKVARAEIALLAEAPVAPKNPAKTNPSTDAAEKSQRRIWFAAAAIGLLVSLFVSWRKLSSKKAQS